MRWPTGRILLGDHMTLLFIGKLLLVWIIIDLLILCFLMLVKPPADRVRAHHYGASATQTIPRTPCPESNFAERLEQPNFQSNELKDAEGSLIEHLWGSAAEG